MYNPNRSKWRNVNNLNGTLFFATSLIDTLFDYTIDIHKASVLNTHARALELHAAASLLVRGRTIPQSFAPFLDEITHSIRGDVCLDLRTASECKNLISNIEILLSKDSSGYSDIVTQTETLESVIRTNYWHNIGESLIAMCKNSDQKQSILDLTDTLIVELESRGYHRRHIYRLATDYFFDPNSAPSEITSHESIRDFLSLFPSEDRAFQIIFKAGREFKEYYQHARNLGIQIRSSFDNDWLPLPLLQHDNEAIHRFTEESQRLPLFVRIPAIEAMDPYSARDKAEHLIQVISDICTFHNHTTRLIVGGYVLVTDRSGSYTRVHRPRPNALHLGVRKPMSHETSVGDKIDDTLKLILSRQTSPQDAKRLFTALEYHRSAIRSTREESQLLELWSLLEGFVLPPKPGAPRLPHYRKYLASSVGIYYASRVLSDLANSIQGCDEHAWRYIESCTSSDTPLERLAELLCCEDRLRDREGLYSLLSNHPLLMFRCFKVYIHMHSPARLHITTLRYQKKVEWQINRCYFMRNLIVHSSETMPHISALVENLHSYIDCLLLSVLMTLQNASMPPSIDAALTHVENVVKTRGNMMQSEKTNYDTKTFKDNGLRPSIPVIALLQL